MRKKEYIFILNHAQELKELQEFQELKELQE